MAHSLTSGMLTATESAICSPVLFIEIDTTGGNVYAWTGYGNYLWNSIVWLGGGNLLGIGDITEQNKVQATGCGITLSGVNLANVAVALENLERYLPVKIWLGAIDSSFNLISTPFQILNGRVDSATIMASGKTATVTVTAESRLIAMRNPKYRRYTDLDQRIEHPNDGGFGFVDTIQDATINFHG